jgi:hypothetical protein
MEATLKRYQAAVVKALSEPDFRDALLTDAKAALEGEGWVFPASVTSVVVHLDNESTIHFSLPLDRAGKEEGVDGFAC